MLLLQLDAARTVYVFVLLLLLLVLLLLVLLLLWCVVWDGGGGGGGTVRGCCVTVFGWEVLRRGRYVCSRLVSNPCMAVFVRCVCVASVVPPLL